VVHKLDQLDRKNADLKTELRYYVEKLEQVEHEERIRQFNEYPHKFADEVLASLEHRSQDTTEWLLQYFGVLSSPSS